MSESLERRLDSTLNIREQRRRQYEAELAQAEKTIRDARAEFERRQTRFSAEVRPLIQRAAEQANRHLAARPERCHFCEVSGYFTGPLYPGGSACNPIAYELQVDGHEVGEVLIVELTHEGMIEVFLGPFRPPVHEAHTTRIDLGWRLVPLYSFNADHASDILVRYLAAVIARWPLSGEKAD
jgi:hypothetical protein